MIHFNFHTHNPTGSDNVIEIESLYFGQILTGTTRYFSAGLHPWYLKEVNLQEAEEWLRRQAQDSNMMAVGEAGLDKLCDTSWTDQLAAFDLCIRLAMELDKPLIIHCVRAYEEVLQQLKMHHFLPTGKAVIHGFDKHPQTAAMLLKAGCYLSFGAALLRPNSHAAEALQQTPADRFFLETDDKDVSIQEIYARAAAIRGVSEDILASEIQKNAIAIFTKEKLPNLP